MIKAYVLELLYNILFSYINVCTKLYGETDLKTTVYKCALNWISPFSILVHTQYFILLYIKS